MPPTRHLAYRPEIDGLRGVAVVAVVLFHANLFVPGGYVGVDIFFVISGYLLTSIIVNDILAERFSFLQFWERRARRLLPPVMLLMLSVLAAGWFLLLPRDFISLSQAATAQALFISNFHYLKSATYFSPSVEQLPLLHTWSLAVEEQFYFLLPLFLVPVTRWSRFGGRKLIAAILAIALLASFCGSVYQVAHDRDLAFYLLPARAWELLCGSCVAVLPAYAISRKRTVRELAALIGAVAILTPMFVYRKETPFPGFAALPPCLGAAAIIWSSSHSADSRSSTVIARLLSNSVLLGIGLISYSLYLWHWPLFAFARCFSLDPLRYPIRIALVLISLVLAFASWKLIETPFRRKSFCVSRSRMYSFALGSGIVVIALSSLIRIESGFRQRFSEHVVDYADAAQFGRALINLTTDDIHAERLGQIGISDPALAPSVLIWGDSHAMAAAPAFDVYLKELGLSGVIAAHLATPPVLDWYCRDRAASLGPESLSFNAAVLEYVRRHQVRDVVLVANWSFYASPLMPQHGDAMTVTNGPFKQALFSTVEKVREAGATAWLMVAVPNHRRNVPETLAKIAAWPSIFRLSPEMVGDPVDPNSGLNRACLDLPALEAAGCRILDPTPYFLNSTRTYYDVLRGGVVLYQDCDHLTAKGANLTLLPMLRRESFAQQVRLRQ